MSATADGTGRLPVSAGIPVSPVRDGSLMCLKFYHEMTEFGYSNYEQLMSSIHGLWSFYCRIR